MVAMENQMMVLNLRRDSPLFFHVHKAGRASVSAPGKRAPYIYGSGRVTRSELCRVGRWPRIVWFGLGARCRVVRAGCLVCRVVWCVVSFFPSKATRNVRAVNQLIGRLS